MQRLGRRFHSFGRRRRLVVLSGLIKVISGFLFILSQRPVQLQ